MAALRKHREEWKALTVWQILAKALPGVLPDVTRWAVLRNKPAHIEVYFDRERRTIALGQYESRIDLSFDDFSLFAFHAELVAEMVVKTVAATVWAPGARTVAPILAAEPGIRSRLEQLVRLLQQMKPSADDVAAGERFNALLDGELRRLLDLPT